MSDVVIRPMEERDLQPAQRIFRLAFGTFMGAPDPEQFALDREYVRARWRNDPQCGLTAELNGTVIGANLVTCWGSFGFFGPLMIIPEYWGRGIAQKLLVPTMNLFEARGIRETALYTFAHSPKHIALYQKFGYWPGHLTALTMKEVRKAADTGSRFSSFGEGRRSESLEACRRLTDSIYPGLDLTSEILSVDNSKLGDTVLIWHGDTLDGFAVCHCGAGTEAGADACYVKFAAARPGPDAPASLSRLLESCDALASDRGLSKISLGVNTARREAYRTVQGLGFRTVFQGVAMHRPDTVAYNRPDVFVLDDWR